MTEKEYPPVPPIDPRYFQDLDWAYAHYNRLAAAYPNQWVAVVNGRVVAASLDLGVVEEEALQVAGRTDVAILFVEHGIHVYAHPTLGPHAP
jgi:hypothetical protein